MGEKAYVENLGPEGNYPKRKISQFNYGAPDWESHKVMVQVRLECGHEYHLEVAAQHRFHKVYPCPQCGPGKSLVGMTIPDRL